MALRMNSVARRVCWPAGGDQSDYDDGVTCVLEILRNYPAAEGADSIYQEVVCLSQYRRPGRKIDENIAERDPLRRRPESQIEVVAGFPGQFAPILRTQIAGLPRQEEPLELAGGRKSLKFGDAATNTRRLIGSCGEAARQDVLIMEDADGP